MTTLQQSIDELAGKLIRCSDPCAGISRNQGEGIIPRSLYLERPDAEGRGCFAVGLNPGRSSAQQRHLYVERGVTLQVVNECREGIANIPYFQRPRAVINQLCLSGPILWSNLAKCENPEGRRGLPPLQTLRHCTQRFLRHELAAIPSDWVVLGIGWEAYRALAYLAPGRVIIGIPHPTGAAPNFRRMFENNGPDPALLAAVRVRAGQVLDASDGDPGTVWLGAERPDA
jgi:hypothetical protein